MSRAVAAGVLVIVLASLFVPGFARKSQAAPPGCDVRDLLGSYGLAATGTLDTGAPVLEWGVLTFDGAGGVTGNENIATSSISGGIGINGTYTVSSDCEGGIFNGPGLLSFGGAIVVVSGGSEIQFFSTVPIQFGGLGPQVASGVMKKTK